MIVDSHCHLHMLPEANNQHEMRQVVQAAVNAGVEEMLCVSVDPYAMSSMLDLIQDFSCVKASMGMHPCQANVQMNDWSSLFMEHVCHPKVIAVGECGLDYYHEDHLDKKRQKKHFESQIAWSVDVDKPLIIHTRSAALDTVDMLRAVGRGDAKGVFHCFSQDYATAKAALDLGFYVSFSGILTFKNASELKEIAKNMPKDRVLVETDTPYLAPVPYRGKVNRPAWVTHVAETLASLWSMDYDAVCDTTTRNYKRLFYERM